MKTAAEQARAAGATVIGVGYEFNAQTYQDLRSLLRKTSTIITGMTPEAVAFIVDVMARDAGLRSVVHRDDAPPLVSWLIAPLA